MNINLNIDQILQHVLPWEFSVTIGGKTYKTCRPSIGALGAMMSAGGKTIAELEDLLNSLFEEKPEPPINWEMPRVTVFIHGYLAYFRRHTEKKSQAAGQMAAAVAEATVDGEFQRSSGE